MKVLPTKATNRIHGFRMAQRDQALEAPEAIMANRRRAMLGNSALRTCLPLMARAFLTIETAHKWRRFREDMARRMSSSGVPQARPDQPGGAAGGDPRQLSPAG